MHLLDVIKSVQVQANLFHPLYIFNVHKRVHLFHLYIHYLPLKIVPLYAYKKCLMSNVKARHNTNRHK